MKREVLVQLILLGVALVAMVLGIAFTRPMEAVHDETLLDVVDSAPAPPGDASSEEEGAPAPEKDAEESKAPGAAAEPETAY